MPSYNEDENVNVFGEPLKECGCKPMTGFYRTGKCSTGPDDVGQHTVCIEATREFLQFSLQKGNDLSTPNPQYGFAGLKPGDKWCLCALRWVEAYDAGKAPLVYLEATHRRALDVIKLEDMEKHAVKAKIIAFDRNHAVEH